MRKKRQKGGFKNRYNFAYTGGDTADAVLITLKKIAPTLIETAANEIEKVAKKRIA